MSTGRRVRHGTGEWLRAILAAVTVGAVVGLGMRLRDVPMCRPVRGFV